MAVSLFFLRKQDRPPLLLNQSTTFRRNSLNTYATDASATKGPKGHQDLEKQEEQVAAPATVSMPKFGANFLGVRWDVPTLVTAAVAGGAFGATAWALLGLGETNFAYINSLFEQAVLDDVGVDHEKFAELFPEESFNTYLPLVPPYPDGTSATDMATHQELNDMRGAEDVRSFSSELREYDFPDGTTAESTRRDLNLFQRWGRACGTAVITAASFFGGGKIADKKLSQQWRAKVNAFLCRCKLRKRTVNTIGSCS